MLTYATPKTISVVTEFQDDDLLVIRDDSWRSYMVSSYIEGGIGTYPAKGLEIEDLAMQLLKPGQYLWYAEYCDKPGLKLNYTGVVVDEWEVGYDFHEVYIDMFGTWFDIRDWPCYVIRDEDYVIDDTNGWRYGGPFISDGKGNELIPASLMEYETFDEFKWIRKDMERRGEWSNIFKITGGGSQCMTEAFDEFGNHLNTWYY